MGPISTVNGWTGGIGSADVLWIPISKISRLLGFPGTLVTMNITIRRSRGGMHSFVERMARKLGLPLGTVEVRLPRALTCLWILSSRPSPPRNGTVHYTSFLPNLMYRKRLLPSLHFAAAECAQKMSARPIGRDWDSTLSTLPRGALERMMDRTTNAATRAEAVGKILICSPEITESCALSLWSGIIRVTPRPLRDDLRDVGLGAPESLPHDSRARFDGDGHAREPTPNRLR